MKKVVRLTESDLVRLVKKVIKENEFDMGYDCDRIADDMEYVYNDTMRYFKHSSKDAKSILGASQFYDDLESELGGLLDMADQNDCENFREIEQLYYDYLDMFAEESGLNS